MLSSKKMYVEKTFECFLFGKKKENVGAKMTNGANMFYTTIKHPSPTQNVDLANHKGNTKASIQWFYVCHSQVKSTLIYLLCRLILIYSAWTPQGSRLHRIHFSLLPRKWHLILTFSYSIGIYIYIFCKLDYILKLS